MFIHIGDRKVISDKKIVGIFNKETLLLSEDNKRYFSDISDCKTVVVDISDRITVSSVSPFTVINRTDFEESSIIWRRKNDK